MRPGIPRYEGVARDAQVDLKMYSGQKVSSACCDCVSGGGQQKTVYAPLNVHPL